MSRSRDRNGSESRTPHPSRQAPSAGVGPVREVSPSRGSDEPDRATRRFPSAIGYVAAAGTNSIPRPSSACETIRTISSASSALPSQAGPRQRAHQRHRTALPRGAPTHPSDGGPSTSEPLNSVVFLFIQTHSFLWSVRPLYHASDHIGAGRGRRPSISGRMPRNRSRRTATSAIWKVTYRLWLTTFAPILTNFSRIVVSDQCSSSLGSANVCYGSRLCANVEESPEM